jgi:hypothetical protein
MGREARVMAEIGSWSGEGKLQLEMDELQFRGAKRITLHLHDIEQISVENGWLVIRANGDESRYDLGDAAAENWMHAIRNPKTLIDKLDVKATSHVLINGDFEPEFVKQIETRAAEAVTMSRATGFANDEQKNVVEEHGNAVYDLVFLRADEPTSLTEIKRMRTAMKSSGAIWVIHMKGQRELSHDAIMAVAAGEGLIDVKSARYSETHACLKLMLRRSER